jgi:hypothetical protein
MSESKELKTNLANLENRISKLIYLHKQVRESNLEMLSENRRLLLELEEEKGKMQRIEEGYKNLKKAEQSGTRNSITQIKKRISDIISELDKNMTLMEFNNK